MQKIITPKKNKKRKGPRVWLKAMIN